MTKTTGRYKLARLHDLAIGACDVSKKPLAVCDPLSARIRSTE